MEMTLERSEELATHLKVCLDAVGKMDAEYLFASVDELEKNHSMSEAAMVLDPNPFTAIERSKLNKMKLKGLKLIAQLKENRCEIMEAEFELQKARGSENHLKSIFGL